MAYLRIHQCESCGLDFTGKPEQRFCSYACHREYRYKSRSRCLECGEFCRAAGQYCSRACYWKHRKSLRSRCCEFCGVQFTPVRFDSGAVSIGHARTCGKGCAKALSSKKISLITGSGKGNWKGGVTADHNHGFRGTNWPKVAGKIRLRDNWRCQSCGMSNDEHAAKYGKSLEVHHKIPFHNFTDHAKANRPRNLVTLCRTCHAKAESEVECVQMSLCLSSYDRGNRKGFAFGERHGAASLTDEKVLEMRKMSALGVTTYRIAKDFGVAFTTAQSAIRGATWRHLPLRASHA